MRNRPNIISISGGKGGTGKSFIAVQLACYLAQQGYRTILVDASHNGATIHSFFGLDGPTYSLDDWFLGQRSFAELALPSNIKNLFIIAGVSSTSPIFFNIPPYPEIRKELLSIGTDKAEVIVIDTGTGASAWSLAMAAVADQCILVSNLETQSIIADYFFLRQLALFLLESSLPQDFIPPPYWHPRPWLLQKDPKISRPLLKKLSNNYLYILFNAVQNWESQETAREFARVIPLFFGFPAVLLGILPYENSFWLSVKNQIPYLSSSPFSSLGKKFVQLFNQLGNLPEKPRLPSKKVEKPNFYLASELGLTPATPPSKLEEKFSEIMNIFGYYSLSTSGLFSPQQRNQFLEDIAAWFFQCKENKVPPSEKSNYYGLGEGDFTSGSGDGGERTSPEESEDSEEKMSNKVKEVLSQIFPRSISPRRERGS